MKTTKFFFMAALALTFAACSNDDYEAQQPQKAAEITITAQLAPKTDGADTRAVSEGTNKIVSEWAVDEEIAILFDVSGTPTKRIATVQSVTAGVATISFTVPAETAENAAATLVYPATAAKADNTGVDTYANLLAAQDGTLNANLDVRVGAGTIQVATPGLTVSTQPEVQNAIFKFTLKDIAGTADKAASEFKVSDALDNVITTVTPGSATNVLYVALPVMAAGTYWFNATVDSKPYIAKATVSTATTAGKYYQSTVKMATIGDVIKTDGKFYAAGTDGAVAKIAYLGSDAETSTTYNHGLALALSDVSSTQTWCSQTASPCLTTQYNSASDAKADMSGLANTDALVGHGSHTHAAANAARNYNSGTHPTGTSAWFLPSAGQWDKMATAASGYNQLGLQSDYYWSSSEMYAGYAWVFNSDSGDWNDFVKDFDVLVRACLAF